MSRGTVAVSVTAVMGFVRGIWRRKDHVGLMRESVLHQRAAEQVTCLSSALADLLRCLFSGSFVVSDFELGRALQLDHFSMP